MEHTETIIRSYGYLALFPLAIIEGPIVTIIGGFLVSLKILNPVLVYLIVIAGDMLGDTIFYLLGRYGRAHFLKWIGPKIGVTHESLEKVRTHFDIHGHKTIMMAKLVQGVGVAGLVAAGSARVPYLRYMSMCIVVTTIQAAGFLTIGYFFGHAYVTLNAYLHYFASGAIVIALVAGVLYLVHRLRISRA